MSSSVTTAIKVNTLEKIRQALRDRPAQIAAAKQKGQKIIGWLNYFVPEEILLALDAVPIRIGTGGDEQLVDFGGRYISTKNCVFVRSVVGLLGEKKDHYTPLLDLLAVDASCLQIFRLAEVVKYYFKYETAILGVPRSFATPEGREYFRQELRSFAAELEKFTGRKLTENKLNSAIELLAQIREALRCLYEYQAQDYANLTWREVFEIVHAGFYLDRAEYLKLLQELLAELKTLPVDKNKIPGLQPRVFLTGSQLSPGDVKLINIIEDLGGQIIGDDLWTGLSSYLDIQIAAPTVDALADGYLARVPHAALPYLDISTDSRIKKLKELLQKFRAQGVIDHTLRYCDPYTFKAGETKDILNNEGFPFLEIHTEYASSDIEAIRTRVEAFLELVRTRNDVAGGI
ncbi:MAG: 2-hydroxyacyl-CoA dehydratase family protein [Candidatus Margulisbacteria bacterium]|jgi:benzoyl-CoA reductase/2-hydroxyglutaryl-CoA dehydratase subunit BcrC/BadD/HgdB|nr:2-hydroxyacyl-CoA dehydratase family protein [Candidatus Margulisiibacteriota bacterium]